MQQCTVADELAFDAMPEETQQIAGKVLRHRLTIGGGLIDGDEHDDTCHTLGVLREEKKEMDREIGTLKEEVKRLTPLVEALELERDEANEQGYRRGLAEGRRLTLEEQARKRKAS